MKIYISSFVDSTGEGWLLAASSKKEFNKKKKAALNQHGHLQADFVDDEVNLQPNKKGLIRAIELGSILTTK